MKTKRYLAALLGRGWMSLHEKRVTLNVARLLLERDKQRDRGECHDHHQLEIVDVDNDLRLRVTIASNAARPASVAGFQTCDDGRPLESPVYGGESRIPNNTRTGLNVSAILSASRGLTPANRNLNA
jgi:hypothetical protein